MKLENVKNLDIQRIGDMSSGIKAGIAEESLPFVFELVSNQLYSNPIGSVVREIASNCFDAHKEIGSTEPIIISKKYSLDEGYSISFQDFGVGMSPERMLNVYSNYFSSSKRADNDLIGGFGIGSKTPLAYTEMFYITTIFDKVKYEYLYHKGEIKPELECLGGWVEEPQEYQVWHEEDEEGNTIELEEPQTRIRFIKTPVGTPTEDGNGTTITIPILEGDISKFEANLKEQLTYFDSVVFDRWNISNSYSIYEGTYYKFRSDIPQKYSPALLHLCIGKVRYAIDFSKVKKVPKNLELPIAVKFEIGELQVTPSRETIRYNEKSIALIEERIALAIDEVLTLFRSQNPEIEDYKIFNQLRKSTPGITFNREKEHILLMSNFEGADKTYRLKALSGLNLKKMPKELFFMWEVIAKIVKGRRVDSKHFVRTGVTNDFITTNNYVIMGVNDRESGLTDKHIAEIISDIVYVVRRKSLDYQEVADRLGIKSTTIQQIQAASTVSKAKTIAGYIRAMDKLVDKYGTKYIHLKPPAEWVRAYQKSVRESSLAFIRRKNKTVFVRDMYYDKGITISEYDLLNRTGITVYGNKEDKHVLRAIAITIHQCVPTIYNCKSPQKAFMALQISQAVEVLIVMNRQKGKKLIHYKDFFKTKFFREMYTAKLARAMFEGISPHGNELRRRLFKDYASDYDAVDKMLNSYCRQYGKFTIGTAYFEANFKPITHITAEVLKFGAKHDYPVPLMQYLSSGILQSEVDKKEFIAYLKSKGVRLKNIFYLGPPVVVKPPEPVEEEEEEEEELEITLEDVDEEEEEEEEELTEAIQAAVETIPQLDIDFSREDEPF